MPRGNDGVQGVIEELRRKSWRRKEKMRTKGYNNSQVCCRFFDPISGENLGRRIMSDMLDLISGGLCEGYRLFCEVEAWVEKEGGGFTPRGLEQVKVRGAGGAKRRRFHARIPLSSISCILYPVHRHNILTTSRRVT